MRSKILVAGLILLSSVVTQSVYANNRHGAESYYVFGAFSSPQSKRTGGEISGLFYWPQKDFAYGLKVSALLYQARYEEADTADNFLGFSAAWHLYAKGDVAPYVGFGVFSGENLQCVSLSDGFYNDDDYYESRRYRCDGDYLLAIYPELGVTIKSGPLLISPFVRRYFDTHGSDTPSNTYGINIGVRF